MQRMDSGKYVKTNLYRWCSVLLSGILFSMCFLPIQANPSAANEELTSETMGMPGEENTTGTIGASGEGNTAGTIETPGEENTTGTIGAAGEGNTTGTIETPGEGNTTGTIGAAGEENTTGTTENPNNQVGEVLDYDEPEAEPENYEFTDEYYLTQARLALADIVTDKEIMALVYLSDEYPIQSMPAYDSEVVAQVPSGQQVNILDVSFDFETGEVWEYVSFYFQNLKMFGYVERGYLAVSDERFLAWENEYGMNPAAMMVMTFGLDGEPDSQTVTYPDIEQFPESYQSYLLTLKTAHPNWMFVKMNTGLDWSTVVANEMYGSRSLVPTSFPAFMQNGVHSPGWAYATTDTLKYYLDPRNGLNDTYIFEFEQLTYNESYQTKEALQTFLNGTFMAGRIQPDATYPSYSITYADLIWGTGSEKKVSPFHLACRLRQEQGSGTSALISGTYAGYEGLYNYFNIGASGSTTQAVIESGLTKAREQGWVSRYLSIYDGADFIAQGYILKGQDTVYLQKFDVDGSYDGLYWHQYMQNICAPMSEGANIRKIYANAGSLENTFVFKIPVYENMPQTACVKPTVSYDVALTPPEGYVDPTVYLDGVAYPATQSNGKFVVTAPSANVKTAVIYKYNANNVPVGMYVYTLSHNGQMFTVTSMPEFEDILTYHGFSIRITGKSGIRFKTGISQNLRNQLTTTGVRGYTLKEYGTLIMNQANMAQYPFIKAGQKVKSGVSYGTNENGQWVDTIYENVNGRYRYTSVLIGLPVAQYKTQFAFRGYIVLSKGGSDTIIYGPPVAKSIYSLSQQLISSGQYEIGSNADIFLQKIITDADALEE